MIMTLCVLSFYSYSQQIIRDVDFSKKQKSEYTKPLFEELEFWDIIEGTPDYYHVSKKDNIDSSNILSGIELLEKGSYLIGIMTYSKPEEREYIGTDVDIQKGKSYYISIKVASGVGTHRDLPICSTDIGLLFDQKVNQITKSALYPNPQIVFEKVPLYPSWIELKDTLTASNNYDYLVIGNFNNNALCGNETQLGSGNKKGYYFINEFSIQLISENEMKIIENQKQQLLQIEEQKKDSLRLLKFQKDLSISSDKTREEFLRKLRKPIFSYLQEITQNYDGFSKPSKKEINLKVDSINLQIVNKYIDYLKKNYLFDKKLSIKNNVESFSSRLSDLLDNHTILHDIYDSTYFNYLHAYDIERIILSNMSDTTIIDDDRFVASSYAPLPSVKLDNIWRYKMGRIMPELIQSKTLNQRFSCGDTLLLPHLKFKPNSLKFSNDSAYNDLNKVVACMKLNPDITVRIYGYTGYENLDNEKEDAYLDTLSKERAKISTEYIINKGIDKSRISSDGFGRRYLKYVGEDMEQRKLNRRVEIQIFCDSMELAPVDEDVEFEGEKEISILKLPINMRAEPNDKSEILDLVAAKAKCNLISPFKSKTKAHYRFKNGFNVYDYWYKIKYGRKTGWIYGYYTSKQLQYKTYNHTVAEGEDLNLIANKYKVSKELIIALNPKDTRNLDNLTNKKLLIKVPVEE